MVSGRNLTRDDARERAGLIAVHAYDVLVDLVDAAGQLREDAFRTTSTIKFDCGRPGSDVMVEVAALRIVSATLNGAPVPLDGWSADTGLVLPGLAASNEVTVVAEFPFVSGGRGMFRGVDPADGAIYLYTSFEPAAAQKVFACFDQPDLKAAFTWHVRVPTGWRAVSNMPPASVEPETGGAETVHFGQSPRMSTYITAVCAGPYAEVRSTEGGRDLGIFCRPSMMEHLDAEAIFDITRRGMDFYTKQFGQEYPLPKYDHVAAPGYMGAMENFGCIVFGERLLVFRSAPTEQELVQRGMVILHELAHMWFGDLVTMRWWDDLWLNEAFATWAAAWSMTEATDLPEPWATFTIAMKRGAIEADQLSSTHPVLADIPDVEATETNFDAITYRKGASVLKQLAAYVGIDTFAAALRGYFADRAWDNATFDDFLAALAAASGRPVREFATTWLGTAQVNTLHPVVTFDAEGRYAGVAVRQEAPPEHPTLRTHRIGVGLYDLDGDRLVRRERLDVEVTGERTEVAALSGLPAADVLLLNDDDLTFAKVRLDERSMATVLRHIQGFASALPRAICWSAASDMVYDAEMPARDLVTLVVNGLGAERHAGLVASVLTEATRALNLYADPDWAPQGWAALAERAWTTTHAAEPGGPLQLAWARAFASAARTEDQVARLRSWFDGVELPEGLRLSPDLRWHLLRELVAAGAAGAAEIDAEVQRDRSITGAYNAAIARALIPTVEAKRAAWRAALAEDGTPLETRVHAVRAYGHPRHTALTADHTATYLSTLDRLWAEQGREVGRYFAAAAFPAAQISPETVAAVDAWLAGEHPAALVRLVMEGRDGIARALRARERDRAAA